MNEPFGSEGIFNFGWTSSTPIMKSIIHGTQNFE